MPADSARAGYWTYLVEHEPGEWTGQSYTDSDPMSTIVIYDSLPLRPVSDCLRLYEFESDEFFPLDGRVATLSPMGARRR